MCWFDDEQGLKGEGSLRAELIRLEAVNKIDVLAMIEDKKVASLALEVSSMILEEFEESLVQPNEVTAYDI